MPATSSRKRNEQSRLSSIRQAAFFLDNVFPVRYNNFMKNPQMTAGPQNPHKTVEVVEKCVKALWGKALKPIKFRISEHIFFPKSSNEKKSHRVEEIPILGPVIARLPGHSIACSLLPLAVLKQLLEPDTYCHWSDCMQPITACGIETCILPCIAYDPRKLHAAYYRLRY